jgi:16S rRNA (adenine1518-N6/adenine1519-N6)-dimethyltransferase
MYSRGSAPGEYVPAGTCPHSWSSDPGRFGKEGTVPSEGGCPSGKSLISLYCPTEKRYDEPVPIKKSRRHALGQHFLASPAVLRKIVGVIDPMPDDVLVEIGAGRGVLTAALAETAGRVIAVEKDDRLIPALQKNMPANVEVIHADILAVDFRELRRRAGVPTLRIVGNIPYSISTPLLFRVLDDRELFSDCAFLLQKEVAARVTAEPSSKSYAPLGILLQNEFEAKMAFSVSPGSFSPPPKVQSALLTLRRRPVPLHFGAADEPFRLFLKASFAERRKMLWNNLARRSTPAALAAAYSGLGIARNVRAEELSADTLFALFRHLDT